MLAQLLNSFADRRQNSGVGSVLFKGIDDRSDTVNILVVAGDFVRQIFYRLTRASVGTCETALHLCRRACDAQLQDEG